MNKVKILFLAANPDDAKHKLALDQEAASIQEKLRLADYRDSVELVTRWAVGPDDLLQALNEVQPQVVHFSGHGSRSHDVAVEGDQRQMLRVSIDVLRNLFRTMQDNIRLVVLNACHSNAQAEAITQYIDCAIGMGDTIPDATAIDFAASLYRAIGFGRSVKNAFEQGVVSLQLKGIPGVQLPELKVRQGVDASKVVLVEQKPAPNVGGRNVLAIWEEKLAFLLHEQAISADPMQRFALQKQIEEVQAKIKELGG
jgi:hypothetical protein